MHTERITFLGTPALKQQLAQRAKEAGISVGELIRRQFDRPVETEEERLLAALAAELKRSAAEAAAALHAALAEVDGALGEARTHAQRQAA